MSDKYEEHTPGKWGLHPHVKTDPPLVYADGCIIATVNTSAPEPGERDANARLIADAPTLLAERDALREALQNAVEYLEAHRPKGKIKDIFSELNKYENGVMKQARAALALSGGGS